MGSKTQNFHASGHKFTVFLDVTPCGLYTLDWEAGPSETPGTFTRGHTPEESSEIQSGCSLPGSN